MPDRSYTEREVADLIERAVERQQEARSADTGETLSLAEIERIAAEAGIDPKYLREAADEMDAVGKTLKRESGTTQTTVFVERWIDAPLTPETWEDAVIELQQRHGADAALWMGKSAGGTVQQIGNAYEWRHTSGLGVQTTVTASPRDGRTRLRLTQLVGLASPAVEGAAYGGVLAALIGVPLTAALLSGPLTGVGMVLAFLILWAVLAPTVTALDRRWRGKKHEALSALADDVAPLLSSVPDGIAAPSAAALSAPALDLDALPDAPDTASGRTARRERE